MNTQLYNLQTNTWPATGRHILAHFDLETIVVYQAYSPAIADYAIEHQRFGGDFSYSRMSWIKPNFLWMMYRSGWAQKSGQERILAITLRRSFFDELLQLAVSSSYEENAYATQQEWKNAIDTSDVRLQWDLDHDPVGRNVERRAVQLGLRGEILRRYGQNEIVSIEDITPFVVQQRANLQGDFENLMVPTESVYLPVINE